MHGLARCSENKNKVPHQTSIFAHFALSVEEFCDLVLGVKDHEDFRTPL